MSLTVTDADGNSANAPSVTIPYDSTNGSGGYWSMAADVPTVTIEQCDAEDDPITTPVQPGSDAYFLVSPSLEYPTSNHATITVPYYTVDGNPSEGLPDGVAYAGVDYTNTVGTLTFTWNTSLNGGAGGDAPSQSRSRPSRPPAAATSR